METESDSKLAFLDTAVSREPDGRLTTSVYRKPTHTDQYLAYDSHHPQSVKRGIVKCLYERAKRLVTKPSVISKEKKHLSSVLVSNGYPFSFLQKITKTIKPNTSAEPVAEFKSTAVLPYVKGFPVNVAKFASARLEDLCKIGSSDSHASRLPPLQSIPTTPDTTRFGMRQPKITINTDEHASWFAIGPTTQAAKPLGQVSERSESAGSQ
ncbi:hypothetical protein ACROYT_G016486 [Oculina patagonica]